MTIPSEGHGLPEGFSLGAQTTHVITIPENDLSNGKNTIRFATSRPVELIEGGSVKSVLLQLRKPDGAAFTDSTPAIPLAVTLGGDSNNSDFNISFASATHGRFTSSPDLLFITAAQAHSGGRIPLNIIPRRDNRNELLEEYTVTIEPHAAGFPDGWEVDTDANQLNIRIAANGNTITFGEPSHSNISEEGGTSTITATVNQPIPADETAIINIEESGAPSGDYIIKGTGYSDGVWTLPTGELTPTLTIQAVSNTNVDDDRTLELAFTRARLPYGWSVTAATHAITIEDNDEPTPVGFSELSSSVAENASSHAIAFDINHPVTLPDFNITVAATGDIEAADVTVSNAVSVGSETTNWTIENIPDNSVVGDRTIELTIQPTGLPREFQVDTAKSTHTLTITDNNDTGTIQFESAASSASEPTDDHTVRLDISAPPASPFDLVIEAAGGGESASFGPSGDANATFPVRIDFGDAEDGKINIVVDINDDNEQEEAETIILTIPSTGHGLPEGFSLGGQTTHTITIPANDQPGDKNSIGFASPTTIDLTEDGSGINTVLQLRMPDGTAFTGSTPAVPLAVTFGGDKNDNDFVIDFTTSAHGSLASSSGLLSIAAGQAHLNGDISLNIAPLGDEDAEPREEYIVTIAPHTANFPDGWEVDTDANRLTIRIAANDNAVTFAEPMPDSITENGGAATVVVTIDQELPAEETSATVTVTPTNENLTRDTDYSLSVSGGELSGNTWTLPTQEVNPVLTVTALSDIASDEILTLDFAEATLPDGWTASDATHTITIDDVSISSTIGFAKASDIINEPATEPGGPASTAHNVKLRLSEAPTEDFIVHFEFTGEADGTNSTGDYSATASHTIRAADVDNDLMVEYPFFIFADDTAELEETFTVTFAEKQPDLPEKWGINAGNNTYTVTIPTNDNTIEFASAGPSTILERTDRANHSVTLTVNINRPLPTEAKINVAVDESTAQSDDYNITGANYSDGVLRLPANTASVRFVVTAVDDDVDDNDESFILMLSERAYPDELPSGWDLGAQVSHTINITDNNRGIHFASDNPVEFTEGQGAIELFLEADDTGVLFGHTNSGQARLLDGEESPLPVDGRGTGVRFPALPGGQHLADIWVNFIYEGPVKKVVSTERANFSLQVQDLNNGEPYTLVIGEDDNFTDDVFIYEIYAGALIPRLSWGRVELPLRWKFIVKDNDIGGFIEFAELESSISEASANNSTDIAIYLRQPLPNETKVNLTLGGTATSADYTITGDAYDSSSNILTFPANEDKVILTLTANDDKVFTPGGKTVTLNLAALTGADALPDGWSVRSGASRHTITIADDDSLIEFVSADSMIAEVDPAGSSATDGVATVSLKLPPLSNDLKLNVAITGTATLTNDYTITAPGYNSGILTIPAMDTSVDFTVTAVDDMLSDSAETVTLTLSERAAPDTFPTGVSLGDTSSHTVTITDNESKVGITQADRVGTLNEPDTGQNWRAVVPVGALGANSAGALAAVMTEDAILQVSLYDSGFTGDRELQSQYRSDPFNPDGSDDYTIGTLTINKNTGMGSFDLTINEDEFTEGREWAFLRISDLNGELPAGWTVDAEHSDYRLMIYGNDNGIRFAEWPRDNPGEFAQLSATVREGGETNMLVLLSHLPPGPEIPEFVNTGGLATFINVPEQHKNDIKITSVSAGEIVYDQGSGRLGIYRIPSDWSFNRISDKTGEWKQSQSAPNVAGALKIEVLSDGEEEEEEVIEITLRDEASPPPETRAWGSIKNVPDTGSPHVSTSTTFTLTIPGVNDSIFFASQESVVVEGDSMTLDVLIIPQLAAEARVSLASSGGDVHITGDYYDVTNDILTLPASTDKVTLTLTTTKDANAVDETVTLTLAERTGFDALPDGHEIGARSEHMLKILETRMIGFGSGEPTEDIRGRQIWQDELITLGFDPGFVHARLSETGTASTMVDVVSNVHNLLAHEVGDVVLDVVASVTGDVAVHRNHRNNPINPDGTEDFTIGTLTLDAAGRGSFLFTVNDDSLIEGREVVTLTLAESDASPLPPGWTLSEKEYYILIEASDNAARFAEWPRSNPGDFASLTPTVREGDETSLLILLTQHAPVTPNNSSLPFTIEVESGHEDDVEFYRLSGEENLLSTDIADDGTLLVSSRPSPYFYSVTGEHYTPFDYSVPIVMKGFGLRVVNDEIKEDDEVITLTLREGAGFPRAAWGSVRNVADTGAPMVETSTTITLTIPANDGEAVGFASTGSAGSTVPIEGDTIPVQEGSSLTLNVAPTNERSASAFSTLGFQSDIKLAVEMSVDVAADEDDGGYTVPETVTLDKDTGQGSFTFTVHEDAVAEVERNVTLTLTDIDDNFPAGWGIAPHAIIVSIKDNDNAARFAEWPRGSGNFAGLSGAVIEGDPDSAANMIVLLTSPAPVDGLPVEIAVESGHENDIVFKDVDEGLSTWDDATNIFTIKSSVTAAALQVTAVDDGEKEGSEEITITMRQPASGFPPFWGAVANIADEGGTPTSLIYTLTVEDDFGSINFSTTESTLEEDASPARPITFELALPTLEQQITLAVAVEDIRVQPGHDYFLTVWGGSYNKSTGVLTIPARTESVVFAVSAIDNQIADSGKAVALTLSERDGTDALPLGLSLGDDIKHTVTIIDTDSKVGIMQASKLGTLNEPDTGQNWRATIPVGALGTGSADALAAAMTEDVILQVSPYDVGFIGDREVHWNHRNNPHNPDGSSDFTIGTLTLDKDTGTGSFNISVNEDEFPEGREWLFLRISDPNDALPAGWTVDTDHSDYRLIIYGNDNGMRFAEWPRNNPGEFAQLSATVGEGGETNMLVLLSHLPQGEIVPSAPAKDAVAALIEVPEQYKDDIRITNVASNATHYNQNSGRFLIYRIPHGWSYVSNGDKTGSWREAAIPPNLAGALRIEVLTDGEEEDEEVIEITLKDEANPSVEMSVWGSVENVPDTGSSGVSTSTVFTLTIPGEDDNIFFASSDSSVVEGGSTTLDVLIIPQLMAEARVSLTSSSSHVSITSEHYDDTNDVLTLPASTDKITLTLTTQEDTDATDDTAALTLAERSNPDALPYGYEIGTRSEHTLNILESRVIGFGGGEPTEDIRDREIEQEEIVTVGFEPHFVHERLSEAGTTSTMVDVVSNAHSSFVSGLDGIVLDIVASATGDPAVHPNHRNEPINPDGTADFTIGELRLDATGRGSFNFTVIDDGLVEGREVVTLTLAESNASPLPAGWMLSEEEYYIVIEANDNVARFAEWPRSNPGDFASLTPMVREGDETGLLILLTQPAPVTPELDNLPFTVEIESGHEADIEIYRLSGQENMLTADIADDGTLLVASRPSPFFYFVSDSHYSPSNSVPVVAAGFGLRVVDDEIDEDEEVVTLTIREGPAFPMAWGSVRNTADTGTPAVETSTTITLTIPANDDGAVGFASAELSGSTVPIEGDAIPIQEGDSLTLNIAPTSEQSAAAFSNLGFQSDIELALEVSVSADGDDNDSGYTVPANVTLDKDTGQGSFAFTLHEDEVAEVERNATLTLTNADGNLPAGWDIYPHTINVSIGDNDNAVRFAEWPRGSGHYAQLAGTIVEGDPDSVANMIVLLTTPAPVDGLPVEIAVESGHENDIVFKDVDEELSTWDDAANIFTIKSSVDVAALQITAVEDDDDEEGSEEITITMRQPASGFPAFWGAVANLADDGGTPTSLTYVLTVEDVPGSINFSTTESVLEEDASPAKPVTFELTLPPLEQQVTLAVSIENTTAQPVTDYTFNVEGGSYESGNPDNILTIPAMTESVTFTVNAVNDQVADSGKTVTFGLSERDGADALPSSLLLGDDNTHTVTIVDGDSKIGITQVSKVGTLNEPGTGEKWRAGVPVGALGSNIADNATDDERAAAHAVNAALLAASMTEDAVLQVSRYGAGFAGDQEVNPSGRNDPFNSDNTEDYSVGTLVIDKDTGTGSLNVEINEDAFPEGREWLFLRISDPNGALPAGWTVDSDHSDYRLIINGNDNSMRFARWPRNNPGETAELSATVGEGGETNMVVLLSHLAPNGDAAALIEVPDAHKDDIQITNVNDNGTSYDPGSGRFVIKRRQQDWDASSISINDQTGSWTEPTAPPNIAGTLKIEVLSDQDEREGEEVIEITLRNEASPSTEFSAWGSVENAPDTGSPRVSTSTVFTLTIPGEDDNIFFASPDSSVVEGGSTTLDVFITPQLAEAASVSLTSSSSDISITSDHYDADSNILTLPVSTDKVTLNLATTKDTDAIDDAVTLTLAQRTGSNALPNSHEIGRSEHRLRVLETRMIGFGGGKPTQDIRSRGRSGVAEVEIGFEPHFVHARLNETGTTSAMVDVVSDAHSSLVQELDGVVLDVVASVRGDPVVHPNYRNNPVNPGGMTDFMIGTLALDATGRGSFRFTVNDDSLIEGREIVTLTLAESDASPEPLPSGWILSEENYYIIIEANDNAASFAEWPRNDPGGFASLAPTLGEGEETGLLILLTGHAPVTTENGKLPFTVEVESGHEDDVEIYRLSDSEDMLSTDIADDGTLLVSSRPSQTLSPVSNPHYIPGNSAPVVVGRFGLRVVDDERFEDEEVVTLTLREGLNFPAAWGAVSDVTDTGIPAVETSTTVTLTIPAHIATIGFTQTAGTGMEANADSSVIEIALSAPAPAGGLNLSLALDNTTGSPFYSVAAADASKATYTQNSGLLIINEGTMSVTLTGSQTADADNLNNKYVLTLEEGAGFPEGWVIDADKGTHTVTFIDTDPLTNTIGWENRRVTAREDAGLVVVHLKLTDRAGGGVPFTSAIPALNFTTDTSDAADFMIDVADAGSWTTGTGAVALAAGMSYEDGLVSVNFDITNDGFEEDAQIHTFTLAPNNLPLDWSVDEANKTLTLTITNDDTPLDGGNTVEFANAFDTINESNQQVVSTKVVINRPNKDEMKFLLTAGPPPGGAVASDADYGLSVESPATFNAADNIVTIPAGTTEFEIEVAAKEDSVDDNFESVVFTLGESEDAMLPDGWRVGEQKSFTVIIFDDDGVARPAATLSQWTRDGVNEGKFAQLSSTTEEGGTAKGGVFLTEAGPTPDGIPLILTVEAGHEDDVTITDAGDDRSSVSEGETEGQYNFVMTGGNINSKANVAATFNINVVDDNMNEPVEVIDISVSKGEGFPNNWTLRDDVVYRLTVPRDVSETGGSVTFADSNRSSFIEGSSNITRTIEASAPAPRGGLTVDWTATLAAGLDVSSVISKASGSATIPEGRQRGSFALNSIDNNAATGDLVVIFSLAGNNLPSGWTASSVTQTLNITDDDLPRTIGGNTIQFAQAAANVNEKGAQRVTTKVVNDRPHKAEMKLLLTADAPESGSAAQESDYSFTVHSPASYDSDTDILTIPAETIEFEVEVAAVEDTDDDDFEAIALTLKESADADTGAQLPEGWQVGRQSSFTVTILDDDGASNRPTATLSQWAREGANEGRYARLFSTTEEGGTARGAIALTEAGPTPDGLNFVLTVAEGHEDDVTLADVGDARSTLTKGRVKGEYFINMAGGNAGGGPNLAATFDINVVDDDENEPIEIFDISVSKGARFPSNWTLREDASYRLTIPRDASDVGSGTLGFTESASTVVEGQSDVMHVIEASAPVPTDITLNWRATVATDPPSDAPPVLGSVISEMPGTLSIYRGYRRAEFSFDVTDNATAGLVDPVVTFTLATDNLPEGWTLARSTHVMTIRDDDATRSGGNLVFFEYAAANIEEDGLQKVSTRIVIDHPGNAEMKFLLARRGPATGVAASDDDYTFFVKSPARYDTTTNIVTVPPGTDSFELEVAARDDTTNDDSEVIIFTLGEGEGAMLPEDWAIDSRRSSFSVTIIDNDGADQRPSATLSRWHREGEGAGGFAQLSSTTEEGGTVQGAVYLTQAGPDPEGLNFLLTVEDGHALDVILTDYGDNRSTLVASDTTAGLYHLHMTGGNFGVGRGTPNVAALFNIHVQEDVPREAEEVVDITLSAGENFPDDWTVRGDAVYRLTIPDEESNVRFRTAASTAKEDSSGHNVRVEVRPPASEDLTFTIARAGTVGPDTASSDDYSLQSGTLTIKAGEPSGSFGVNITNDSEVENDETIVLALSGKVPTGYRLDRARHTLTIEDDDDNTIGFETSSASVEEGEEVNLRIKFEDPASVALSSLDSNLFLSIAIDGNDDDDVEFAGGLTLLTPLVTLTDGVFEFTSPVLAVADEEQEDVETVTFTLGKGANFPDGYVIDTSANTFTLTIAANGQVTSSGTIQFAKRKCSSANRMQARRRGCRRISAIFSPTVARMPKRRNVSCIILIWRLPAFRRSRLI